MCRIDVDSKTVSVNPPIHFFLLNSCSRFKVFPSRTYGLCGDASTFKFPEDSGSGVAKKGLVSFTLNEVGVESVELCIYNSGVKSAEAFSAKGDSGSRIWK